MIREIGDHVVYEDSRRVGYPVDMEALAKEANYRVDRLGELLGLSPRILQRYDYLAREVQFFEGITPEEPFLETESKGEGSSKEGSSLNHPRSVETMVSPSPGTGSAF